MRILLTGASSFTGHWFARTLAAAGHHIVAPLRGTLDTSGPDRQRVERLRRMQELDGVELIADCRFGSDRFLDVAGGRDIDVICLHHAEAGDYRNPEFDVAGALAANTLNLRETLRRMGNRGLRGVVLTGTFFEPGEGAGSPPLAAFSAYGLSKGLTAQVVQHRCHELGFPYGKFVIPHPFGPLEQPRLGAYLARCWSEGKAAEIRTPSYIRDNIHVSLLALSYKRFVEETPRAPAVRKLNPSGYVESQGAFVERMAREIGRRLGRQCTVRLLEQTEFLEPVMRVNTDPANRYAAGWDEDAAWDNYAEVAFRGVA
jgi:UDP-glucose 4-epimerase